MNLAISQFDGNDYAVCGDDSITTAAQAVDYAAGVARSRIAQGFASLTVDDEDRPVAPRYEVREISVQHGVRVLGVV